MKVTLEEWYKYLENYDYTDIQPKHILSDWQADRDDLQRKIEELKVGWDNILEERRKLIQILRYILSDTSETAMLLKQMLKKYDDPSLT